MQLQQFGTPCTATGHLLEILTEYKCTCLLSRNHGKQDVTMVFD